MTSVQGVQEKVKKVGKGGRQLGNRRAIAETLRQMQLRVSCQPVASVDQPPNKALGIRPRIRYKRRQQLSHHRGYVYSRPKHHHQANASATN